jgi:ribosomal protein RSM22 (predicted rRNA methylase)
MRLFGAARSVQLPAAIRASIDQRAEGVTFASLRRAAAELSEAYRGHEEGWPKVAPSLERVVAYLVTRMPATYAAASAVLAELAQRLGSSAVRTLLDAGAGTGAASLAARQQFPGIERLTLLEPDVDFAAAGREWLPDVVWVPRDLRRPEALPERDLVVASYTLGEMEETEALAAGERLWRAAHVAFVLIEPGTPRGFALVRKVRDTLLAGGAHMAAPCPGEGPCPMSGSDWCHFGRRLERSSLHRRIKGGELGFEDEKFSYVALVKQEVAPIPGRILRRPQHRSGLITLEVCRGRCVERLEVRKGDRKRFRAARGANWGDSWMA